MYNLATKIKVKHYGIVLGISIITVLFYLNWYQSLLVLKIPISLLSYSRSFYSVYLFLILLPILLVLPKFRISIKIFTFVLLAYAIFTILLEFNIRSTNKINLLDRILVYAESEVSVDAIDNMHLTKMPLGIIYKQITSWVKLPSGDVGSPYRKLFNNELVILLILAQLITVLTIVRAICSFQKYRLLMAVLGIALIKHVFDGGFFSASGLALFVVFTLFLYTQSVKSLNVENIIKIAVLAFVICLIFSAFIKKLIFAEPDWTMLVLERQLWACGVLGTALLMFSLYQRSWQLFITSLGFYTLGIYINPVIYDDLKYAYQPYSLGQRLAVFVNSPTKKIKYLNLKKEMQGYEIYQKYNLRPGYNWISVVTPDCQNSYIEYFFKVRGDLIVEQNHEMANLNLKKCSSMEWCQHTVKARISECLSIQNIFPEIFKYLLVARQPIFIRGILRSSHVKRL